MSNPFLTALQGDKLPEAVEPLGAVTAAPKSPAVVLERFRSATSKMQANATASARQEVMRICNLPVIQEPTEEEIALVSKHYCPDGFFTLFPEQVKALMQFHDYGNILCPVKVGGGKTLICVLVANDAFEIFKKRRILLMNPTNIIDQLKETELPLYRRHMSINVPFYWMTMVSKQRRLLMAKSKKPGVYVVSYDMLSRETGEAVMNAIEPDMVIGDEIHRIASARSSVRNGRFKKIIKKYNPAIVSLSGTLLKKSIKDYRYIVNTTLKENSFLPLSTLVSDAWAALVDSDASSIDEFNPSSAPQPGPIRPLIFMVREHFPEEKFPDNLVGFRNALKFRSHSCPGVVASDSEEGGVPLRISNITLSKEETEGRPGWGKLQEIIHQVTKQWQTPNGDEIPHAMHIWSYRYTLEGFGFYNSLYWPEAEALAEHKKISVGEAKVLLERSIDHHLLKQEYNKALRHWLSTHTKTGMDSTALVGKEMSLNGPKNVGDVLYNSWKAAKDADFENKIERYSSVVRVCDFRLNKIVEWAKWYRKEKGFRGAILWFKHQGVGDWLEEAFKEAGLPYIYCPSGKKGKALLEDRTLKNKFAIATMGAYREGLNLQFHHDTEFFCQWPREANWAEQAMGRVQRSGQTSDEARIFTCISLEFDKVLFASTLNDAAFSHQTDQRQKLLYANYDQKPEVLPYSVLLEWSGKKKPIKLDRKTENYLNERFKGE